MTWNADCDLLTREKGHSVESVLVQVVGVANTYPLHMLQRQTNWVVDSLAELELDRIEQVFKQTRRGE